MSGNNPLIAAKAVADAAVAHHGPQMLQRGGPVGRAARLVASGLDIPAAAALAAKQGKGHMGELRVSCEGSAFSGMLGFELVAQPNPVANDPRVDVDVMLGAIRVGEAQVKIGSKRYVRDAARRLADDGVQLVANAEARTALAPKDASAYARTQDHLRHDSLASLQVTAEQATADAVDVLTRVLSGDVQLSFCAKAELALAAGGQSALFSSFTTCVLELIACKQRGEPATKAVLERALAAGARSFVTTGLQSYLQVSAFLSAAGPAYRGRLVQIVARQSHWAGALADFVVASAQDIWRWTQGEMTGEEVLRRAGAHACAAGGAAIALRMALPMAAGLPFLGQLLVAVLVGCAGYELGRRLGEKVFLAPAPRDDAGVAPA